ncbi:MAG: PHP domain-containing protein [Phycisphaerales bacterium]
MPLNEFDKIKTHPAKRPDAPDVPAPSERRDEVAYAELAVTTNYTFLTGASHPEEMVEQAAALGHAACAIVDLNTLAGIVRAHCAAKAAKVPLAIGSRLRLRVREDDEAQSLDVLTFATSRDAYSRLSRLLTLGKRRAPKGECDLTLHDLLEDHHGLLAVVVPPLALGSGFVEAVEAMRDVFRDDRLSLAVRREHGPDDGAAFARASALASYTRVPLVAVNDAHYHTPARRDLQDVLTCIRHGCTIHEAGARLYPHGERFLKAGSEMLRLFPGLSHAVRRSVDIALRAAAFSLDELRYEYRVEVGPPGVPAIAHLRELTMQGAAVRYGSEVPKL